MLATGHTELEWIKIGKEKLIKIKNFGFSWFSVDLGQPGVIGPSNLDRRVDPWS